jgi:hypothetical protein
MYSLLLIGFTSYYVIITTQFEEVITWILSTSPSASGLSSGVGVQQTYSSIPDLLSASFPFYVFHSHFAFWLGFTLIGLWVLFTSDLVENRRWQVLLAGFVPAAVLYYPNPVWIVLRGIAELSRWQLMMLPLLIALPALGLKRVVSHGNPSSVSNGIVWIMVILLVFTSLGSGLTNPGLTDFAGIDKEPRRYLSGQQIAAAEWTFSYVGNQTVRSSSELPNYIEQYSWARPDSRWVYRNESVLAKASYADRRVLVEEGLTVFSVGAFREEGVWVRLVDINLESYSGIDPTETEIRLVANPSTFRWNPVAADTVYTNGETVIVYEPSLKADSERSVQSPESLGRGHDETPAGLARFHAV